jgi:hypothetical protein
MNTPLYKTEVSSKKFKPKPGFFSDFIIATIKSCRYLPPAQLDCVRDRWSLHSIFDVSHPSTEELQVIEPPLRQSMTKRFELAIIL